MNKTGESLDDHAITHAMLIAKALAAPLTLLSGGGSGASTYRVHGLSEPCVLKIIEDESADHIRTRGYREIHFYTELAVHLPLHTPRVLASLLQESGDCALLIAAYESLPPATPVLPPNAQGGRRNQPGAGRFLAAKRAAVALA